MSSDRHERVRLSVGLAVSLLAHAAALVPLLLAAMGARTPGPRMEAVFESEQIASPPAPEDEIPLGIDKSDASTLTWIGYEQYQEHLAALSEVEQAAQQINEPGGAPAPPVTPPTPTITAESSAKPPGDELDARAADAQSPIDDPTEPMSLEAMLRELGIIPPAEPGPRPPEQDSPRAESSSNPEPVVTQVRPVPAAPAPQPTPTQSPSQPPGDNPAEKADRESDATSTIDVPPKLWKAGKPLAAHGLQIQTRRPEFTILTRLTASVCDPVLEIRFRSDGRPSFVRIIKSACDDRVDSELVTTLYRWRATGKPLENLTGDETMNIRMQILLSGK